MLLIESEWVGERGTKLPGEKPPGFVQQNPFSRALREELSRGQVTEQSCALTLPSPVDVESGHVEETCGVHSGAKVGADGPCV